MNIEVYQDLQKLWDYLSVGSLPEPCDVAFVLGRDDFSIPEKTIEIYNQKNGSKAYLSWWTRQTNWKY